MLNGISNSFSSYGNYGSYQYGNYQNSGNIEDSQKLLTGKAKDEEDKKNQFGTEECQTCAKRKYQDASDENVSFKAATHLDPTAAAGAVRAHEGEHVSNAYSKAAEKNGKVVNASVAIYTSVCPECGDTYVSGGKTFTTIKYQNEDNPYMKDFKEKQGVSLKGQNFSASL